MAEAAIKAAGSVKTPMAGRPQPAKSNTNAKTLSYEEVLALPVSVDLVTAAKCFGISRTTAHELVRDGRFPCQVLRLGVQYRVTRSELFRVLGIETAPAVLEETA